ncbi:hypothetical protein Ddc_07315 [Ditylenchus destructor]|nr:hypothetical protein Ddc_07315 [Ditylenchus destructor]
MYNLINNFLLPHNSTLIQLSTRVLIALVILGFKLIFVDAQTEHSNTSKCERSGDRFVKDYIQYECFTDHTVSTNSADSPIDAVVNLIGKPIGCVPTNRTSGPMIVPGATHTTQHFRYECVRDPTNAVTLKITHCVDNTGKLVSMGEFYTQPAGNGEHMSVECVGDEFRAKKVVHKWTKCTLSNGRKLIEGNFVIDDVDKESLRSVLQKSEITSCVRDNADVALKCTGCVTSTGVHLGVTNYVNVGGQWTQCRKYKEGCRLINVTSDYVDCQYEGKTIANGNYFQSASSLSSFYCNHGVVTKQGCLVNGSLILMGDVRYINDRPFLCEQSDQLTSFNGLIGCDLPDGKFKRFLETWREGSVMKRCSWLATVDGITQSQIVSYACMDGKEPTTKLNLVEYHGAGGKSGDPEIFQSRNVAYGATTQLGDQGHACVDILPYCNRLVGYCTFMKGPESGLAIESYAEFREVQSRFEKLANSERNTKAPIGCKEQLTPFQKFQVLVEVSCAKTCMRCTTGEQKERLITNLERTSHCGR